jgi:hypothetical protein
MNEETKQAIRDSVNDRYYKKDAERIASSLLRGWAFLGAMTSAEHAVVKAEYIEYARSLGAK